MVIDTSALLAILQDEPDRCCARATISRGRTSISSFRQRRTSSVQGRQTMWIRIRGNDANAGVDVNSDCVRSARVDPDDGTATILTTLDGREFRISTAGWEFLMVGFDQARVDSKG